MVQNYSWLPSFILAQRDHDLIVVYLPDAAVWELLCPALIVQTLLGMLSVYVSSEVLKRGFFITWLGKANSGGLVVICLRRYFSRVRFQKGSRGAGEEVNPLTLNNSETGCAKADERQRELSCLLWLHSTKHVCLICLSLSCLDGNARQMCWCLWELWGLRCKWNCFHLGFESNSSYLG